MGLSFHYHDPKEAAAAFALVLALAAALMHLSSTGLRWNQVYEAVRGVIQDPERYAYDMLSRKPPAPASSSHLNPCTKLPRDLECGNAGLFTVVLNQYCLRSSARSRFQQT